MPEPLRRVLGLAESLAPGLPWLKKAGLLARTCGATLELCAADVEQYISASWAADGEAEYRAALRARRLQDLAHLAGPLHACGIDAVVGKLLPTPLERSLIAHVLATGPDLVIKISQHFSAVPVAALLQTDWTLASALSAPLLLAGPRPWPRTPVIAVIGDEGAANAVGARSLGLVQTVATALAGEVETVPLCWSTPNGLMEFLHHRGVCIVVLDGARAETADVAARVLEQLEGDVLIVPAAATNPDP
jgi:hypothetical protein